MIDWTAEIMPRQGRKRNHRDACYAQSMAYTVTQQNVDERFATDDQSVAVTYIVTPWSARSEFYGDILGGVRRKNGRLYRQLPARCPGFDWLFAQGCSTKPFEEDYGESGPSDNVLAASPAYLSAVVTVTYKPLSNDLPDPGAGNETAGPANQSPSNPQQEMDLASLSWDFSARNLKLPNQWFIWDTDSYSSAEPLPNQETSVTKIYPGLQIVMTRHLVASVPVDAILGQLGRVNNEDITLANKLYRKEMVRFDSAKANRKVTSQGYKYFELSFTFAVNPVFDLIDPSQSGWVGWNRLFDPKRGYWRHVKNNTTGKLIYDADTSGPSQKLGGKDVTGFKLIFHPQAV
jgi:hypothetical protein